jgi:hypothetical protein
MAIINRLPTGSDIAALSYQRKSIPNGIGDIARLIGLDPSKTVFDYNVSVTGGLANPYRSAIQQGIACMSRGAPIALTLGLPVALKMYWKKYLKINNVEELTAERQQHITHDLYKNINGNDAELKEKLRDKTFVTLRTTITAIAEIEKFNSTTLLSNADWKFFNSKVRTTSQAAEYGYLVSPFVIISTEYDLYRGFLDIKKIACALGLNPETTTYWFRFDNLSGGVGVRPFNPSKEGLADIFLWVTATIEKTENKRFAPILLDIDIGSLPGVKKIVDNLNVQGVCGRQGSTFVGVTQQETDCQGRYLRGSLPNDAQTRAHASVAAIFGMPVINAAQKQGFRGYAGVDVILLEMLDGTYRGYILEMNARLNSSTSLLSLAHFVASEKNASEVCAENITLNVNDSSCMEELLLRLDNVLYKGAESDFSGVIPIIAHSESNGYSQIKTVVVAPSALELAELRSELLT